MINEYLTNHVKGETVAQFYAVSRETTKIAVGIVGLSPEILPARYTMRSNADQSAEMKKDSCFTSRKSMATRSGAQDARNVTLVTVSIFLALKQKKFLVRNFGGCEQSTAVPTAVWPPHSTMGF